MSTITRYAIKNPGNTAYFTQNGLTENIWEACLYTSKPSVVDNKVVLVEVSYKELSYVVE